MTQSKLSPKENRWLTLVVKMDIEHGSELSAWESQFVASVRGWLSRYPAATPSTKQQDVINKLVNKYMPSEDIELDDLEDLDDLDELDDGVPF